MYFKSNGKTLTFSWDYADVATWMKNMECVDADYHKVDKENRSSTFLRMSANLLFRRVVNPFHLLRTLI